MPNDIKKIRRRVMCVANYFKHNNPVILKGQPIDASRALKYAWWFEDFRSKLSTGKYRFSYFKIDGGIREAVGTLNPDFIPEENKPQVRNWRVYKECFNYTTFCYLDLTVSSWRSFRLDLFIGFVEEMK